MKFVVLIFAFVALFFASSEAKSARINAGNEAEDGQFPYMTMVTFIETLLMCNAVIIHPRWALTEGRCMPEHGYDLTLNWLLNVGTSVVNRDTYTKTYVIDKFYSHENYTLRGHNTLDIWTDKIYNDIGLLHLSSDIEFNDRVNKIQLETDENKNYENTSVTLMGWEDKVKGPGIRRDHHLHYSKNRILSTDECKKMRNYVEGYVCIPREEKEDVSDGYSGYYGSPAVADGVLIAINSGNSFYTKVASYIPWIKSKMSKHGDSLE